MFTAYYTLKSQDKLPLSAKFIDPQYNITFSPIEGENMPQFLSRITATLKFTQTNTKSTSSVLSSLTPDELRELVIASLIETSSSKDLKDYFTPTSVSPTFTQVKAFAKSIARETLLNFHNFTSPFNRESRIKACLSCPFHKSRAKISPFLNSLASKVTKAPTNPTPTASARLSSIDPVLETQLGVCGMCGCGLKAKIKFKVESVLAALHPNQLLRIFSLLPKDAFSRCWILKESVESSTAITVLRAKLKHVNKEDALTEHLATKKSNG